MCAVLAPAVPGLAYAAAILARSVSVYRLRGNGAFPKPAAARSLVWALVCPVARVFPHGYENRLCVGAELAIFDAARFQMSAQLGQDAPAAILA